MDIVQTAPHDVLLRGGRVIDPAQGLDGIFDVAVRDGLVSVRLVRNQIRAAATKTGVPLEPIEMAALDLFDELAYDPAIHLDMDLQQGDIQFCNNYTILHSRTAFEDHPEPARRRHMVRLWLTMEQRRPLADGFPPQNGYGDRQLVEPAMQAASLPAAASGIGSPR